MLSSSEVSQMMGQQNQLFASQAAFSHQISQQMPSYGNGQGFSYGGMGSANIGSDFGSRVGGGVTSALGGAANFALSAGTIMGGFGMLGKTGRAITDPFAGGGAMWGGVKQAQIARFGEEGVKNLGVARRFLPRIGAGIIGAAPVFTGIMMAGKAIGSAVAGAQEQAGVENVLSNVSLGGGQKFGRSGAMQIGNMMRDMQALPEMMTSMSELTRVMDKMNQVGMMHGAAGVNEFGKKFKEGIKTLKQMSKVMGSTMEEALPMFSDIQSSGFYSQSSIINQTMKRHIVGGISGMGQGQVSQIAGGGAQMSFAMGGTRATGASHAMRVASELGMASQMGILKDEDVREMTGMGGAAGIQALSGQVAESSYRMSRGRTGKAYAAALGEQVDGRFTGKMDERLMAQFRGGAFSAEDIRNMAKANLKSEKARMSWRAQPGMQAELAGGLGAQGQFAMMQNVLGEKGFDDPDAAVIVAQKLGMGNREARMQVDMARSMGDIGTQMRVQGKQIAKKKAQEAYLAENFSWESLKGRVSKRIEGVISDPFKKLGANIRDTISGAADEFVDELTGRYKVRVTEGMAALSKSALMGVRGSKERHLRLLESSDIDRISGMGADMSSGTLGKIADWAGGTQSAGSITADRLRGIVGRKGMRTITGGADAQAFREAGGTILSSDRSLFGQTEYIGIDKKTADRGFEMMQNISAGLEDEEVSRLRGGGMSAARRSIVESQVSYIESTAAYHKLKTPQERAKYKKSMVEKGIGDVSAAFGQSTVSRSRDAGYAEIAAVGGFSKDELVGVGLEGQVAMLTAGGMEDYAKRAESTREKLMSSLSPEAQEAFAAISAEPGSKRSNVLLRQVGAMRGEGSRFDHRNAEEIDRATGQANFGRRSVDSKRYRADLRTETETVEAMSALNAVGAEGRGYGMSGAIHAGAIKSRQGTKIAGWSGEAVRSTLHSIAKKESGGTQLSEKELKLKELQPEMYAAAKDKYLIGQVISKGEGGKGNFTPDELEFMERRGIDPNGLTPDKLEELKQDQGYMAHLNELDKDTKSLVGTYNRMQADISMAEQGREIGAQGAETLGKVKTLQGAGVLNKQGEDWLGRAEKISRLQMRASEGKKGMKEAFGHIGEGGSYGQQYADLASEMVTAGEKLEFGTEEYEQHQETVMAMGEIPGFSSTMAGIKSLRRNAWKKGKGGKKSLKTAKEMMGSKKYLETMKTEAGRDFIDQYYAGEGGTIGYRDEDTNEVLGKKESLKKLEQAVGAGNSVALAVAAGVEQKSKYASEADVAAAMKGFTESVTSLATIIKTMQTGKTEGEG